MRILTITASDAGVGGAARVAMELHRYYASMGNDSRVFAGKKVSGMDAVTELRRPFWRKAAAFALANDFEFFDGKQILQSSLFQQADVVHCHNLNGWYFQLDTLRPMAKLKPVVWTLHDMWGLTPHSAATTSRELENGLFKISDPALYPTTLWNNDRYLSRAKSQILTAAEINLVAPSRWLAGLVEQTCLRVRPLEVIPNGIDVKQFTPTDKAGAKAALGLAEAPVALFIGAAAATNPFKGFADFEWLAESSTGEAIQFVCLGADADRFQSGVRQFAATSDKARVAQFLAAADVLVMPSRSEIFPLVMLEAMACGTPVVAYDVGGIGELLSVAPGCALVTPNDKAGLKRAVEHVAATPAARRAETGRQRRSLVEQGYSLPVMGSRYVALFERLLAERRARA